MQISLLAAISFQSRSS